MTEPTRTATFSHAPSSDLSMPERVELFDQITRFRKWCKKHGCAADVRALPADPDGHRERRGEP